MKKLFFSMIAIAAIAVFSVSGCNKGSGDEILIGEYGSLTGPNATFGISSTNGLKLAVEELNNSGGLLGKKVKLITYDDQGKPSEAQTVVQRLIKNDNVVAVIGEVASSNSKAGAPICQQNKIPMITPASTNPEVTAIGDYIFRVCFIDPFQATVVSKFILNTLKLKKVALLKDVKNAYSTGLADFFEKEFRNMGGEIVEVQSFSAGDKDFKAQLTSIKAKNPEAIFIPAYYTDVNLISIQAREIGLTVPLIGSDGWESEKLTEGKAKDALEGCYFSTHVSTENPDPKIQEFITKYKAKYNSTPDAMAFLAYDAGLILFEAMKKAGTTDPEKVKNELAKIKDFLGVTGKISINEQRNAVKPAVILEIKGGEFKFKETVQP
ncbi:MAG TPA: ABC transporter substrate-binding protein [Ignavibacteria bacterium]|nr:ethanolamine utilization protein EutJ [Bacteroidota bacterium]HRE11419.1 ABC transporter substrate-binding protein [Ignavibacteria bacterium]HRF65421.1 ABC transporter substrate-binding protein [Ignavibacteria bacterium]HRJ04697.1 ABC transporter substrate-binding protein [Ignavibacteria bacterium]HRJ84764.1 ABC transporter substrate-binding protein [Ignavibacteria bacterium]